VAGVLGRGREEGAEGDIVGARLAGFHGEMTAVVAGDADLRLGAEQRPGLARIAVTLAEMDAVGVQPPGQRHVVIDDEGDVMLGADRLQRRGESRRLVLVDPLHAKLEGGHRSGGKRLGKPLGKSAADVERRDQIELASPAVGALEALGKARIELDFLFFGHDDASDALRTPVKQRKRSGFRP
jgi:hypothetical protein